jgi:hypothetical protein
MTNLSEAEKKALLAVEALSDPSELRKMMINARKKGAQAVYGAAFSKLCSVQPSAARGTLEHDVWQSIYALEEMLKLERGKTVLLGRTRQKISRDGEKKTVADLALKAEASPGFHQLIELGHPELLFEAVVLRHPESFTDEVRQAASNRLIGANVDLDRVAQQLEG